MGQSLPLTTTTQKVWDATLPEERIEGAGKPSILFLMEADNTPRAVQKATECKVLFCPSRPALPAAGKRGLACFLSAQVFFRTRGGGEGPLNGEVHSAAHVHAGQ